MTITISHTAADGTLVEGTSKGDGTNTILKAHGFRWFRTLGLWGIAASRDRQPNEYKINRAADALRAAGHTVTVDIDRDHRPAADAEADRLARQDGRAAALAAKATRKHQAAQAAWDKDKAATAALPPGGEPIKVGHHSEGRHRNALDKAWKTLGAAVAAEATATDADHRAQAAAATTGHRYNPRTVANRIDTLEAEHRADQRALDGHTRTLFTDAHGHKRTKTTPAATGTHRDRIIARMAQRAEDIAHWTSIRADQIDAGQATDYTREAITPGDLVRDRYNDWLRVRRTNAKSVTVEYPTRHGGGMLTATIKYPDLTGHRVATPAADDQDPKSATTRQAG
ncbi:hypothetical protein BH683_007800 [Williamsia sp. 1138]|uniref:DUF3560 domain-containing protein n=1 Tax=Williamsia sp. 1138 TaxID=1903117 RepID=UPI000A0F99A5|nr:DUF3560 domain-containing protein [Williamsia sp. 1138]OZG29821.1 hypothetical protein BH683_007800 [Williamsia sp. 1138]